MLLLLLFSSFVPASLLKKCILGSMPRCESLLKLGPILAALSPLHTHVDAELAGDMRDSRTLIIEQGLLMKWKTYSSE